MKNFYSQIKNFINIALFLGIFMQSYTGNSQTNLAAGDLLFTGYDSNFTPSATVSDVFSFVLLKNIEQGTQISFSDRGFFGGVLWQVPSSVEGSVTWTSGSALLAGTEITINGLTASTYNVSNSTSTPNGTVTLREGTMVNGLNLANVGDQLMAFQGGNGSITGGAVTMIAGLNYFNCSSGAGTTQASWNDLACADSPNSSVLPPGLTGGTNAFYTGGATPKSAKFTSGAAPVNTLVDLRASLMNPIYWTLSGANISLPSGAPYLGSPPSITGNPASRTVCPGNNTTFGVAATGATSYQWQVNNGSGFADLVNGAPYSNVTTPTLNITGATASMNGYTYRAVVTGSGSATSNAGLLTVPNMTITTTAQTNVSCNGGNNGSATIEVSGGILPYTYSWSPSGGTGTTASGLTAQTYTVTVTDGISCSKTHTVIISEPTLAQSSPSITAQPASYSSCAGSTATFGVTASNTSTYQWQVDNGSGFADILNGGTTPNYVGSNTANLTINNITAAMNGFAYRVVLTSTCSKITTSNGLAKLIVNSLPIVSATPSSKTICSGTSPNIALSSNPSGATFAWTVASVSGTVNGASAGAGTSINQTLTGNGVVNYTVTPTLNSCPGLPITIAITVNALPVVTANPNSETICSGSTTNIALTSAPSGATFAWTVATATGTVNGASAGSGTTIAQSLTGNGIVNYTVTPTINGCPGSPLTVAVTVRPLPVALATPALKTICSGASPNIALTSTPTGASFSWTATLTSGTVTGYSNSIGTVINQTLSGNGVVTYTVTPTLNGCPGVPITIPVTVSGLTSITTQADNRTICKDQGTTFSATATNAINYQWQENKGSGFFDISNNAIYSNAQTATLTISSATAAMNGYQYQLVVTGNCNSETSAIRTLTVNNVLANPTQTNVSCNGGNNGSATVAPSGGNTPYSILWSNGATTPTISGLAPGNYSVTIKDAMLCETVQNFTITQPPVLAASKGAINNVSCNNGANGNATVLVTGGTGTYTYLWAPSGGTAATASGLAAGTYTVTVKDANLCQTTESFTITEPTPFSVTTSQTDILCKGSATGSAKVEVTGAAGSYTYSWAPSGGTAATATGLVKGTYTVTITDVNNCFTTRTFTINEPLTSLVATAGSQTNVNCHGEATGSATVNVTGGTGNYTYSWAPSGGTAATASGLAAGTYTVTVNDANLCQTTQSFTITQPAAVLSASTASTAVSCFSGSNGTASVTVSGGTPNYTYAWAPLGGTASSISGRPAGNYTCTITDSKGCTLVKNVTIGTPNEFTVTTSKTDVSCNGGTNGSAEVTVSGGTPGYTYSWAPSGGNQAIATGLAAGTYIVTIDDANSCQTMATVTIGQPTALSVAPNKTDVLCNGGATGSAGVTVSGGTQGYTYVWTPSVSNGPSATGLTAGQYACKVTDAKGCTITQNFTINQPSVLTATTSQIDATCTTLGEASVTPNGGATPYTYLWSPSGQTGSTATSLAAGFYTCTITDANGCTITKNFTITTTNTLTATASQSDVLCNGANTGSAKVVPSGAPGPFTFVWAPSGGSAATASNLTAGNYSVTITSSNGCSIVKNFTISEPPALVVTPSQTNLKCNGATNGSASVTVMGGTGNYTYLWSPSGGTAATATGLGAGTYTVTIKDANLCTKTQSFTITEPAALATTITKNNVSCNGASNGSASVTVTGGTGNYTYLWSPSGGTAATATGLAPGTYVVTVQDDNLCQTTETVTITEPNVLSATASHINVSCHGQNDGTASVNVTGGTGTYTYDWSPSGGNAATAANLAPGTYTVTVTDTNSCQTTASVTITEPNALSVIPVQSNITCNGQNNGSASVNVTGGTGSYTYVWSPSGGTAATATGLSAGTYTVKIKDTNSCETTQSFTISEPDALVATASSTNIVCNGANNGSASVNVTGGTGSYTYSWSPSGGNAATANGLTPGTYIVTLKDANLCQTTATITISEPAVIAATTSQVNVSCNGQSDGSATVSVTGGTGSYTYVWSPSGGTAATATGLTAGNYSVKITDSNGCFITKTVTISVTPDNTAPVPTIASLPAISNYCSILSTEIPIPTAIDNCTGTISATTTDPLNYNLPGNYVITWKYNDGNGNISTQQQNLNVLASPLATVTLTDAEYNFNGNLRTISVTNLPAGANVSYSIAPSSGTLNGAVNAGVYTITAVVSPAASSPNCSPVTLSAKLTINKVAQQITFGALAERILGTNNNFNLEAVSSSGLPIRYSFTYSSALPAANVSPTGQVTLLRSGQVTITAHQDGNANYLPAAAISQVLVIKNNDVTVTSITIGGVVYSNPAKNIHYLMQCEQNNPNIAILNNSSATITPSANFTVPTPKPGIYTQNVTVTSQDGSTTANYTITVEKPFAFSDIVVQKFNTVLLVNNNPATNGGYEFVSYQWFKNGTLVGTGQYYSAGNNINDTLDPLADYSVKMTTKDGKVLQTCASKITIANSLQAKLYPNPIQVGKVITVEADFPQQELDQMQISLYSVSGQLIQTVKSSSPLTEIQLPQTNGSGIIMVVLETPNIKKSFKVIVK